MCDFMTISKRILKIRGDLSREKFAAHIDVSTRTVQRWETENDYPKGRELVKIGQVFNVNIHWLLTGEGEPYIEDNIKNDSHVPLVAREDQGPYTTDTHPINGTGDRVQFKISEAMAMAARVLDSGTSYGLALYLNIQHFDRAIRAEEENKRQAARIENMEKECDELKKRIETMEEKFKSLQSNAGKRKASGL